jgi:ankyrin repeat protein
VQALARALPKVNRPASLAPAPIVERVETWVEVALFGSEEELKKLLDSGLDANATTESGGTTLLMLVQPDLAKTKMLLNRGAKVNARARSKYSALMLTSMYPGSRETARLLLDRGAQIALPAGAGKPMFNANPMMLAVFAGNAELIPLLGPPAKSPATTMLLLGFLPTPPALAAVAFDDVNAVRALLDAGVSPNEEDDNGFSLLYMAVVADHTNSAKLLIERGAKVNAVDQRGMTPLLYAASADFGDDAMVRLLLNAGADPSTKTKDGLTALDLARKYGHHTLAASLAKNR